MCSVTLRSTRCKGLICSTQPLYCGQGALQDTGDDSAKVDGIAFNEALGSR